jgi:hypothetical protein
MKSHLCFVGSVLAGIIILHHAAFAENAEPDSIATAPAADSASHKTIGQSSRDILEQCENEWSADKEAMMKHNMTEDSYVAQCSVKDDVPAMPSETKTTKAPPSSEPK